MAVYFARSKQSGDVKIGHTSTSVAGRLKALQTGNPDELEVHLIVDGWGPKEEAELHQKFAEDNIRGEWFRYSDDIRYFVEQKRLDNTEVIIKRQPGRLFFFEVKSKTDIHPESTPAKVDFEELILAIQDKLGIGCTPHTKERVEKWKNSLLRLYLLRKITGDQYETLKYRMEAATLHGEWLVNSVLCEVEDIKTYCIVNASRLEDGQISQKELDEGDWPDA